ncbi:transposase [Burkholderia multivorans]|nr:transposase [Burkholderia multivorans]
MMLFDDLRDNEWALVEGLFCSEPARSERRGRPRVEARSVVNAVLWVLSTGEGWSVQTAGPLSVSADLPSSLR